MRNNYPLITLGALITLLAFSLAQVRYVFNNYNGQLISFIVLTAMLAIGIGIIYHKERKEADRFEKLFPSVGQKGGTATKREQKNKK